MPAPGRRAWRCRVGNELRIAHRIAIHSELKHPVEEKSAAARVATVESEDELVPVVGEVVGLDRPLEATEQPPLG